MANRLAITVLSALLWVIPFQGLSLAHVFTAGSSIVARDIPSGTVNRGSRVLIVGRLKSPQPECRQGETVELKRKARILRTDTTDAEGEYRFKLKVRKTVRVFVRFNGSVQSSYGHSHTCNASKSRTLLVKVKPPPPDGNGGVRAPCDKKSYPSVCIRPYPPDLDCDEIPYTNFTVKPPDPHGFDGDGNGIGCET